MKNVMRKVCSLFLVSIVTVSMFGFIAPTRAEAVGCSGQLCLEWYDKVNYGTIDIYIYFLDFYGDILDTYDAVKVKGSNGWVIKFPRDTTSVVFEVYDRSINEYVLYHDIKFEDFTSPYALIYTNAYSTNENGILQIVMESDAKPAYQ